MLREYPGPLAELCLTMLGPLLDPFEPSCQGPNLEERLSPDHLFVFFAGRSLLERRASLWASQQLAGAQETIFGQSSAHCFAKGPWMAELFISPLSLTMSSK